MSTHSPNYEFGILYLIHLIISADGVIDEGELKALEIIIEKEGMDSGIYRDFIDQTSAMSERDIYERGIELISGCTTQEQIRAFAWLMKISESDGHIHAKEIRFLLYSIRKAGIDFNQVVDESKSLPELP